jgi:pimeloyl-ACP methyl ester carboxylesterase
LPPSFLLLSLSTAKAVSLYQFLVFTMLTLCRYWICAVLIVTGDKDRLVPAWNAERLSKAIPGSRFEVIKNCGHLPHEERVEEFSSIVERFLQSVFVVQV